MEPSLRTLKALYAFSRNECAFPGCTCPIAEPDSATITGVVCHINARNAGGPRFDPMQTDADLNALGNLILLCGRHHKIVDTELIKYTADRLRRMQSEHQGSGIAEIQPSDLKIVELLLEQYKTLYVIQAGVHVMVSSPGAIQATNVTIKTTRQKLSKVPLPQGVLGSDTVRRPYIKHLIDRYNDFAKLQKRREFNFGRIYSAIKHEFKAHWEWVPLSRFDELASFLQGRIDKTTQGKINGSKGHKNFSTFEDFENEIRG
jgi:hypothetical protein